MRVVSLFLPRLAVERLRRQEPPSAPPERRPRVLPVDDDPGACSVPRGGHWRPGARWARDGATREEVEGTAATLPAHQRPGIRELGRRSEAAAHPFRSSRADDGGRAAASAVPPRQPSAAPPSSAPALVLAARVGRREELTATCRVAEARGLSIGMALTHARALEPGLEVLPADPQGDAALLDRLALHAARHWAPIARPSGQDGLWIDLTGAAHLHGGERRFAERLVGFCRRLGLTARAAVADTPGCAHALARHGGTDVVVVPPGRTTAALLPLPVAALRLADDAVVAARRFGLVTVADLVAIPRGPLARRLGLGAVARLDQATGAAPEPIAAVVDETPPTAELRLLEPIGTPEQIETVASDLCTMLVEALRGGGLGARAIRVTCRRVDGVDQSVTIGTARPTRDAAHLLRLLRLRLDRIDPGLGLEAFTMVAERCEPLGATPVAGDLSDEGRRHDPAGLVDVLAGRIGAGRLHRHAPVESHVPERCVLRASPLSDVGRWPSWPRPARLLARPEPLFTVLAQLPDHPPKRFEWRGRSHRVVAADGPERIHGEWWRREAETSAVRDYYRVEDEDGRRWWIFRRGDGEDAGTGDLSWWMHGAG